MLKALMPHQSSANSVRVLSLPIGLNLSPFLHHSGFRSRRLPSGYFLRVLMQSTDSELIWGFDFVERIRFVLFPWSLAIMIRKFYQL